MGDQASGHQATATIDVSIVENTWVPLDPVHLAENLKVPYPHHISQVSKWLSVTEVAPWMVQLDLSLMEIWGVGLGPSLIPPPLLPVLFPSLSPSILIMEWGIQALGPDLQSFTYYPLAGVALCCDLLSLPQASRENSCHPPAAPCCHGDCHSGQECLRAPRGML